MTFSTECSSSYDFQYGVLVVETAPAYTPPAYDPDAEFTRRDLTTIWERLVPDVPVPMGLVELAERPMRRRSEMAQNRAEEPVFHVQAVPSAEQNVTTEGAFGSCGNGCCDVNYLMTFSECQGGFDYSWAYFDIEAISLRTQFQIEEFRGFVCAATGMTHYTVAIGGGVAGGDWDVPEGWWRTFHWSDSWFGYDESWLASSNSSPLRHAHCGKVKD